MATAALSLFGALQFYNSETAAERQSQNRDPYMIGPQYERFSGLRQTVPENAILGYLTDAEPGSVLATTIFDAAQYALAPRLLQAGTTGEWVLGNFTKPLDFEGLGAKYGLHLERYFGSGVVLYRKQGR
jgi:hypothetical protein